MELITQDLLNAIDSLIDLVAISFALILIAIVLATTLVLYRISVLKAHILNAQEDISILLERAKNNAT